MSAKVHYFIRTDRPQNDGSVQVYFVFALNRTQRMKFATGKYINIKKEYRHLTLAKILEIPPEKREELYCWDSTKQRATKGNQNTERLNYYLISEEKRANDIILSYQIQNKTLSVDIFKRKFFSPTGTQNFKEYFLNEVDIVRKNTLEENSKKTFRTVISRVEELKPNATLADIDYKFLVSFKDFLMAKGNCDVTVNKYLKRLRTLIKISIKNQDFSKDDYPFADFKIEEEDPELTNSDVCEPHELLLLESKYDCYVPLTKPLHHHSPEEWRERNAKGLLSPGEQKTLRRFLVSCHTGLRYQDTCKLKKSEHLKEKQVFNQARNEIYMTNYIEIETDKKGVFVTIPLSDRALRLINETETDLVFESVTGQKLNEHLKSIAKKCEINKDLTFHVSRHTFGTLGALAGIEEKVRQLLMGHKNRKYTSRYTHVAGNFLFLEMEKIGRALLEQYSGKRKGQDTSKLQELLPYIQNLNPDALVQLTGFLKLLGGKAA
jgi:integrase/recombinase XerD